MKRILCLLVILAFMATTLVGCADTPQPKPQTLSENLKESSKEIASNQQKLEERHPVPKIDYSNERENLRKRAMTFGSDPNKVSYIYLLTSTGSVISFYTVKGKVSNVSSYLVPDEQIVKDPYAYYSQGLQVQSPDIDGSYGTNGDSIFFYTTDGVYVEWSGDYLLCDQPLKITTTPVLVKGGQ